jgi:hypothetical protein
MEGLKAGCNTFESHSNWAKGFDGETAFAEKVMVFRGQVREIIDI